ncbi:MAG: hypothetical protein GX580_16650 [Candidatus Hydrogenedens sp.]|nr:SurA N-terminal domain-containing protein [Candidatus Hydrogenedentota bacterium]NLF59261.1 hypothetical protein [Candidatus Hydrogenedens sp.]
MQDFMRKHRKIILGFILLVIGVPMVFFFGMPSAQKQLEQESAEIAKVGGVPISEAQFRRALDGTAQMMARSRGGQRPTYEEMDKDGTVQMVMEQLIDSSLITLQEQQRNFTVNDKVLHRQIQDWAVFKDENGNFKPAAYNEWVRNTTEWDEIYDELRRSTARQVYLGMALAPSRRITESQIDEELEADYTKLTMKYVKIEPPVTPTDEEIQKQYDENQEQYRNPADNRAEFIFVSLQPDVPEKALEVVKAAREGADFAELAKNNSALTTPEGGDMGWRKVEENPAPHIAPLYALAPGEVSEPVSGPTGFFIYKVDEERTDDAGVREVHYRQIIIEAALSPEERTLREDIARQISETAKKEGLQAAEGRHGLPVQKTGLFTQTSIEIENVNRMDVPQFRSQLLSQKDETVLNPITARNGIYVGKVVETIEGVIPPLAEVRDRVSNDVVTSTRQTDAYKAKVDGICKRIKAELKSIDEIPATFPELETEVKLTDKPFTRRDMLYQYQIYMQTQQVYDAIGKAEPGTMAGPLQGMLGDTWFVQLVERIPPTQEDQAKWPEERKQRLDMARRMAESEYVSDFTKDLRERMLAQVTFTQNTDAFDRILGRGKYAAPPAAAEEGAEAAPADGTAAAPAESAPAESAPAAAAESAAEAPAQQ